MKASSLHSWEVDYREAVRIQEELALQVRVEDDLSRDHIGFVAGADVSHDRSTNTLYAAICVFSYPELELIELSSITGKASFPYIPGLLSFREGPVVLAAAETLTVKPDVILFDGQGIAHPRKLGLASHLGILLDLPTIGCAKSVLVGEWERPAEKRGASSPLIYRGEVVGDVLRTKDHVNPLFISPGHKVGRKTACEIVLSCSRRYRVPEPTRQAHIHVTRMRSTHRT